MSWLTEGWTKLTRAVIASVFDIFTVQKLELDPMNQLQGWTAQSLL